MISHVRLSALLVICMDNEVKCKVRVKVSVTVLKGLIICIVVCCTIVALAVPLSLKYGRATAADRFQFGNFHVRPSFLLMVALNESNSYRRTSAETLHCRFAMYV